MFYDARGECHCPGWGQWEPPRSSCGRCFPTRAADRGSSHGSPVGQMWSRKVEIQLCVRNYSSIKQPYIDWHLLDTAWEPPVVKTSTPPASCPVCPSGCSCLSVWPVALGTPLSPSAWTQRCTGWWTARWPCACHTPSAAPVDKDSHFTVKSFLFSFIAKGHNISDYQSAYWVQQSLN